MVNRNHQARISKRMNFLAQTGELIRVLVVTAEQDDATDLWVNEALSILRG